MGYIDVDLQEKFEFYSYGHALEILYDAFPVEWGEIQKCLRELRLTVADLKKSGGNESPIPKKFDNVLYPFGWREIRISGDLIVKKYPRQTAQRRGRFADQPYETEKIAHGFSLPEALRFAVAAGSAAASSAWLPDRAAIEAALRQTGTPQAV